MTGRGTEMEKEEKKDMVRVRSVTESEKKKKRGESMTGRGVEMKKEEKKRDGAWVHYI